VPATPWDERFFATTRGRLLWHLRHGEATVDELARALDLTDNGIRAQLALLERDGLVREDGVRRTANSRKPSQLYHLAPGADRLFPKPYGHVLGALLAVLGERLSRVDVEAAVREVGRRLASEIGVRAPANIGAADGARDGDRPDGGDTRERLTAAVEGLHALGGVAEVVEDGAGLSIHGVGCPLAAVVADHAEICGLTEAFIGTISGLTVCQRCERGPSPRCRFDVVAG
jgi:predicted ArsR family transcriptional regulator